MTVLSEARLDMVRAFFCDELDTDVLAPHHLEDAADDVIAELIPALQHGGLFSACEVDAIAESWISEPAKLFLLLGDVADTPDATSSLSDSAAPAYLKAS